jgi:RNA polymerase sigma factor (sigma-70 family)
MMTAIEIQYQLISTEKYLMRFAYNLTEDKEDAKDLLQDTFLKALNYCDHFAYDSNFKAWIYTIMKNIFINNYNRTARYHKYSHQIKEELCHNYRHTSDYDCPDTVLTTKELEKTLETLDENLKMPFKMFYEGFKYKEIAETLDLKLGTVKSRIFFARKKLMNQLNA